MIITNSGGIDFAVMAAGYNSLETMCPCHAWMVPLAEDESAQTSLAWSTEEHPVAFQDKILCVTVGVLKVCPETHGDSHVRTINDKKFAVLKRGLMYLASCHSTGVGCISIWLILADLDNMILIMADVWFCFIAFTQFRTCFYTFICLYVSLVHVQLIPGPTNLIP